ncbi:MAG: hypothetical protein LC720_09365, partial [Actinobacteria bacterium]|nr:hypothetical protein [Actinomycetota bacterium]
FAAVVRVGVPGGELCALALDLPRYARAEPRLRAADWIDGGPAAVGAAAEVVGDIPFALPVFEALIGQPRGVARLEELDPGTGLAYSLETPRARGYLRADFAEDRGETVVEVRGWICPRSRAGRRSLRPLAPMLNPVVSGMVGRAVARAAAAVASGGG